MGLDVGSRRIGVAIADELGILASPVGYVSRGDTDRTEFRKLISHYTVSGLIVGIPRGLSGLEGPQAKDTRGYATSLARDLDLPVTWYDERLTTIIAERTLLTHGRSREQRKQEIDAAAAAVMLQGYLDAQGTRAFS